MEIALAVMGVVTVFALFLWNQEKTKRLTLQVQLEQTEKARQEQKLSFEENKVQFENTFRSLAGQVMEKTQTQFLELASERFDKKNLEAKNVFDEKVHTFGKIVDPLQALLKKMESDFQRVEQTRGEQFGRIVEQMLQVSSSSENLRKETSSLTQALRRPEVRGSWGEIQLRRVVELAGMSAYCDFEEQVMVQKEDRIQKPDLIVRLPNHRVVIVDAKAVLDAYLDATQAQTPEERKVALDRHARNVRSRVQALAKKSYWEQFEKSPDFAVLFIPNEALLAAAVEVDRDIIEDALKDRIIIATPTTLVALLKAIAYGWQQEQITANAQQVLSSAKELYERLLPWIKHLEDTGKKLGSAVKSYNDTVRSLDTRVLPSARRIRELGLSSAVEIDPVEGVELVPERTKIEVELEESAPAPAPDLTTNLNS